ncbi:MAG: YceD family protein [Traorella sp.]
MKWTKGELLQAENCTIEFDERIEFNEADLGKVSHLRKLRDVRVNGDIHYDASSDMAIANLHVSGVMVVPCCISLEDVDVEFDTSSTEVYSFAKNIEDLDIDVRETKKDIVELYPAIFQLIVMEIPFKVVKENAKYPKGKGWEVVSEEELRESKKDQIDPRLAKLKEFKIDE